MGLLKKSRDGDKEFFPGRLVTLNEPDGFVAEAYRTLRASLIYSVVDSPPKSIMLTSSNPQEGKSTTCANLGVVLAQADKRVLIMDCDFRKPVMHRVFELRNVRGIVDVLAGERKAEDVWHEPLKDLKVMTVGPIPPNPAELLGSVRFATLLEQLREEFDYILLDVPPIQLVSDAMIVASQADGVLLILDARNTRKNALRRSVRALHGVGANILGTVMNNADGSRTSYYGSYGGYVRQG